MRIINKKTLCIITLQLLVIGARAFASTTKTNSWIDLPVIELIEYFTVLCSKALQWAGKYAKLFAVIGVIWAGLKIMLGREQVKKAAWDMMFKCLTFFFLIEFWPAITYGFLGIATEIGENIGPGREMLAQDIKTLYAQCKQSETYGLRAKQLDTTIAKEAKIKLNEPISLNESYANYLERVRDKIKFMDIPEFSGDKKAAQQIVDRFQEQMSEEETFMFSGATLMALNSVCTEKKVDGTDGSDLVDTYVQIDTYLVDKNGDNTAFISPAAMLRLACLCGSVMYDRWQYEFKKIEEDIHNEHPIIGGLISIAHGYTGIYEFVQVIFCQLVLILSIAFAMIQYVMTLIEFTIVSAIAAAFLPLMLFDGTKDVPKKFIPVFIGMMMKIICILVCVYFVSYILTQHAINVISETWGMNLFCITEIAFISILCYILTQNAPQIAQTILTGQPRLSMGEALQGAGTAAATAGAMKQAPGAAMQGLAKVGNKITDARGFAAKVAAAAGTGGASAVDGAVSTVAKEGLKDRMKAKFEAAGQKSGTGFSMLDKGLSMAGLSGGSG
ncbi:MAG: type IV secretion system protein, partial [Treponema sp.]|nr:type IV secretion system protein [Treponema sp.]